jgi:hypothetical protein
MAIHKSLEETVVLNGTGAYWGPRCVTAMQVAGFTVTAVNEAAGRVEGTFKKGTVWGKLVVSLMPAGPSATQVTAKATANVDNIYAAFRSPGRKILEEFKAALTQLPL